MKFGEMRFSEMRLGEVRFGEIRIGENERTPPILSHATGSRKSKMAAVIENVSGNNV